MRIVRGAGRGTVSGAGSGSDASARAFSFGIFSQSKWLRIFSLPAMRHQCVRPLKASAVNN